MDNMAGLAALLQTGNDVDEEQLAKELMRHQAPVVYQVRSLIETLRYQKSLIPQHVIGPLIEAVRQKINKELDALK